MSLRKFDGFPSLKDQIYFNNAAQGAVPESTIRVIERYMRARNFILAFFIELYKNIIHVNYCKIFVYSM